MINQYLPHQASLVLESDLAGEFPLYLYWPSSQSMLLYSASITELLSDVRVSKPLKVSVHGLSFLLQSGVVPPPKTAYQDIYIVGIGDEAQVGTKNDKVQVTFSHQFPFMNANRLASDEMQPDEVVILQMLAEATQSRIDESKPSYLFHSAGKDSNSIALALAEAGWQHTVTLLTHKSKGKADESEISAKIAKQLGFKHQILYEVDQLQIEHHQAIEDYFIHAPFPCTDNVTLAYPLYVQQLPELRGANIIDGGGNDSYMATPPTRREAHNVLLSKVMHRASFLRQFTPSESSFLPLIRTSAECFGINGLSFMDAEKVLPDAINVYPHWKQESHLRKDWDLFDFKTDVYSTRTIAEVHIRKARNFSDSISSNFVLPFANQHVAEYFSKVPEEYLFDRKALHNKIILRRMLKNRLALDSDKLGKMGFSYDSHSMILQNWVGILNELQACPLWEQTYLMKMIMRLKKTMQTHHKYAEFSGRLIYRMYLLSAWYNKNRYLNA